MEWFWVAKRCTQGSWFTRGWITDDKINLVDCLLDVWRKIVLGEAGPVE